MPKLFIAVLALLGALLLPAAAASAKDRNHDRIPDRWEKKHDLSLHVKQTRRDQDHDGLRNLAEFKGGMDPRDKDSDDDGIKDDDENAGTITKIDGANVTITTFANGEVTGMVTDATEIECEGDDDEGDDNDDDARSTLMSEGDDDSSGPGSGDDDSADEDNSGPGSDDDDPGDDDQGEDEDEDDECAPGALALGAKVHEAELELTSAGPVWEEIELR